ncbi:MAG TPA: hypothetical protein VNK24_06630 [Elusimicrobiota bacterium]|nr:hypothetical protein [Elusimicrobiota bacterium]
MELHNPRHILTIGFGILIQTLLSIASFRLVTTFLSPAEMGRYWLIVSVTTAFAMILINPIGMYVNRRLAEWKAAGSLWRNFKLYWKYLAMVATAAAIILFALNQTDILGLRIETLWLIALVSSFLLFNTANVTLVTALNLFGERWKFVLTNNLTEFCGIIISVALVCLFSPSAEYWLAGQIAAYAGVLVLTYRMLKPAAPDSSSANAEPFLKRLSLDGLFSSTVFHYSWPISISVGLYWIQIQGYRFALSHIADIKAVGFFATSFAVGISIMSAFDGLLGQFYQPVFYNDVANSDEAGQALAWEKYASFYCPAAVLMGAFGVAAGPLLLPLMTGKQFHAFAWLAAWGALTESVRMINSTYGLVAHARLKMRPTITPGITGAAATILAVVLLARWNVFLGTAIALLLGMLLSTLHLAFNMHRLLSVRFPIKRCLKAALFALPLGLMPAAARLRIPIPNIILIAAIFLIFGLYVLLAQWILAKPCLALGETS